MAVVDKIMKWNAVEYVTRVTYRRSDLTYVRECYKYADDAIKDGVRMVNDGTATMVVILGVAKSGEAKPMYAVSP